MGKTFAGVKLCHTDDFPSPQNEGIKRWVENNGGIFQRQISADTTHLICSQNSWKRNSHLLLKEARRHNKELAKKKVPRKRRIQIVKYDWLEDSLQSKSRKPKPTALYDWEQKRLGRMPLASPQPSIPQSDEQKAAAKIAKMDRKMIEFNKEIEDFEAVMQTKGYHPYADSTGFLYLIVLVRRDIEKNLIERHRVKLFESDDTPRKYACYLAYTAGRAGVKRETQELAPANSDWEFAWAMFTKIFKLKTGVEWEVRPELSEATDARSLQIDGGTAGLSSKHFEYVPPKLGLPQGLRFSNGGTDGPVVEAEGEADEEDMEDIVQSIEGVDGVDAGGRRPSVTVIMPASMIPAPDAVDASALTPTGGW